MSRIAACFAALKRDGRAAFVPFLTAGDPDPETCYALLERLPGAGADVIELGVPFTDPMADGPAIQEASIRALKAGMTLRKVLEIVTRFRAAGHETPIVLMGYFNPIHAYGVDAFLADARKAGVDGLIVVDLPPEEDGELCEPAIAAGIDFIRLTTPTTVGERLPTVLRNSGGFLYYVSVTGVTGGQTASAGALDEALARLRGASDLPIAVGFGIKTPEQAADVARKADGVVIGSAIVSTVKDHLDETGAARPDLVQKVTDYISGLSSAVHDARK